MDIEEIDNIVADSLKTFMGQYLTMFHRLTNSQIPNAVISDVLDSLSAERDPGKYLADRVFSSVGTESFKYGLPIYNKSNIDPVYPITPELEKVDWNKLALDVEAGVALENNEKTKSEIDEEEVERGYFGSVAGKVTSDGMTSKVNLGTKDSPAWINLQFRYQTYWASSNLVEDIVKANYADISLRTRLPMYLFGAITFKELMSGSDVVKRQERIRLQDSHDLITKVFDGTAKDTAYALATGKVPVNRASAVIIISQETVNRIESTIRGSLENFKVRERFFDSTAAQTIIVIDEEDEMVVKYYRGIRHDSTFPLRRLKKKSSNVGEDLIPLIKTLADGNAPRY